MRIVDPWASLTPGRPAQRKAGEFRAGWRVLLGCTLGGAIGVAALPNAVVGLMMHQLQADLGWSRAAISLAPTILFAALAATAPIAGWIADRTSAARIVAFSFAAMCVGFLLFSRMGSDIRLFYAGFALIACLGSGASPLTFARVISARFRAARGRAMGVAMIGNGLAGAVISLWLLPFSESHGWRAAYVALAAIVAVVAPVVVLLLSRAPSTGDPHATEAAAIEGDGFKAALARPAFWLMAAAFGAISVATMGLALHYVAFMIDEGLSAQQAAALAGLAGLTSVAVRLGTGWLLDRCFAPHVGCLAMLAAASCFAVLAWQGGQAAPFGAIAIGLAIGAEIDLIGYMTGRYFGMRAYGRCYGVMYAFVLIGSTLSPLAYGLLFDRSGTYQPAFWTSSALLVLSAAAMLGLPRFPQSGMLARASAAAGG